MAWHGWGEEAFERARREDKLLLVDSGATWCHWCHVMDRVTYEDPEVTALVGERFVPVRIDRDRLPEVDARLQREPALVQSSAGGWPLTAILTPDNHVLYKATFLPPRAGGEYGASMGLVELLLRLDEAWKERREEIATAGEQLADQLRQHEDRAYAQPGDLGPGLIDSIVSDLTGAYDPAHGGFGQAPKFFHVPALELLSRRAWADDEQAGRMLHETLRRMARGGVYDHLAGGFHRYSVDERWHVPHFEKMAYDNAGLLALYADAAGVWDDPLLEQVAGETRDWILRELTAGVAFAASQDADVGLSDDGDYFTWTAEEVRQAAGERAELVGRYYAVDEVGDMHGRRGRNVLHVPRTLDRLTEGGEASADAPAEALREGKAALLAARRERTEPAFDRTVFADLNGMVIDALLTAADRLGDDDARGRALAALDYLLAEMRDQRGVFAHFCRDGQRVRVGLLADQAWMLKALVHAFAATGRGEYLDAGRSVAAFIREHLTADDGALLSAPRADDPYAAPCRRGWEDAPSRSAASVAADAMIRLAYLTGENDYRSAAVAALGSFAGGLSRGMGIVLGGYGLAVDDALNGPRTVVVVGSADDPAGGALIDHARRCHPPGGMVLVLDPADRADAALLDRLGHRAGDRPCAYACAGTSCQAPATTPDELDQRWSAQKSHAGPTASS
jgi:hypothetical protein